MSITAIANAGTWDSESGEFVNEDHRRLAEILHDYNPYFALAWIPPKDRNADDTKPFAIVDNSPNVEQYIMRTLSEQEMKNPTAILQWVFEGDLNRNRPGDVLARMEAEELARKLMDTKRQEDVVAAQEDLMAFMVSGGREKKHYIRHDGQTLRR